MKLTRRDRGWLAFGLIAGWALCVALAAGATGPPLSGAVAFGLICGVPVSLALVVLPLAVVVNLSPRWRRVREASIGVGLDEADVQTLMADLGAVRKDFRWALA
jgi:hypothetical protein